MQPTVPKAERHLIALDIDGTIMPFGERDEHGQYIPAKPEPEVAEAIRTLHRAGHEVVVATGRAVEATLGPRRPSTSSSSCASSPIGWSRPMVR